MYTGKHVSIDSHVQQCQYASVVSGQQARAIATIRQQYDTAMAAVTHLETLLARVKEEHMRIEGIAKRVMQAPRGMQASVVGAQAGLFQQPHECLESGELVMPFNCL